MAHVIVFGTSKMGTAYAKVLDHLGASVTLIGRDEKKAQTLAADYGFTGLGGGIDTFNKLDTSNTDLVIIASSIPSEKDITIACLKKGIKNLLIEKPGAINKTELDQIEEHLTPNTNLHYAHNRRFYNSVLQLRKIIAQEGITGLFFDFTERVKDVLGNTNEIPAVIKRFAFCNSIHVIDTAFYLAGMPEEITTHHAGSWEQHPSGTTFAGSGTTERAPFSYIATWQGAGRWNIEVATNRARYKLSPLEELQKCEKNQFTWKTLPPPDTDDHDFKPGLLKMVVAALHQTEDVQLLPTYQDQVNMFSLINKICNYED